MQRLRTILFTGLLILAVLLTAVRLLIPRVGEQQHLIAEQVTLLLGQPVEFAALSVRLFGFQPEMVLDGVEMLSADREEVLLRLDQLVLRLSPLDSLLQGELVPALVRLEGGAVAATRVDEQWSIVGLDISAGGDRGASTELVDWFLSQQRLEVVSGLVSYQHDGLAEPVRLSVPYLLLDGAGSGVTLNGRMELAGSATGSVKFSGYWKAQTSVQMADAYWRLFIDADELGRDDLSVFGLPAGGFLSLRCWGEGTGLDSIHLEGSFDWRDAVLGKPGVIGAVAADQFSGRFIADSSTAGWRGRLHDVAMVTNDQPANQIELIFAQQDEQLFIDGWELDIELISRLAGLSALPERERRFLQQLAPAGSVSRVSADLSIAPDGIELSALSAVVEGVVTNVVDRLPAVDGLAGEVLLTPTAGMADIDAYDFSIWFPDLFRQDLRFDHLRGQFSWQQEGQKTVLTLPDLYLRNSDLELAMSSRVLLSGQQSPVINLVAELSDFDISRTSNYLPVGVIPPATVRWLDDALVAGLLTNARMLWRGALDQFPYQQGGDGLHNGTFLITGEVVDGVLNYVPHRPFPEITDLYANLRFAGERMEISGNSGRILDSQISKVNAVIEDLRRRGNRIQITGEVDGPLSSGLRYLTESALNNTIGRHLADLQTTGQSHVDLQLDIPFRRGDPLRVAGTLTLPGNRLEFTSSRIVLNQTRGELHFTQRGVFADELRAVLFGGPASLSLRDALPDQQQFVLGIDGHGSMALEEVESYLGWQPFNLLEGTVDWRADLEFQQGGFQLELQGDTTDSGFYVPTPLGKARGEKGRIELGLGCRCAQKSSPLILDLSLDNEWFAQVEINRGGIKPGIGQGVVSAGRPIAELGDKYAQHDGVVITGAVGELNFDQWQEWLGDMGTGTGDSSGFRVNRLDLQFDPLVIADQRFPALNVSGELDAGVWSLDLLSNQLKGRLSYQLAPAVLSLDADWLSVVAATDDIEGGTIEADQVSGQRSRSQPPELNVSIDMLTLNGRDMGALTLHGYPQDSHLIIDDLLLDAGHSLLRGEARLARGSNAREAGVESNFSARIETDNFGEALALAGYPQSIAGGAGKASWQLVWPGGLSDFRRATLTGTMALDVEGGSMLGLEPGLGRLFGVLSLGTLQRRMSLDFRDLVGTGFVFDDLAARVEIDHGESTISRLRLRGPAADIDVAGRLHLGSQDLDLRAEVVPKVTESLPLAATIGSVGLGAAVYLGQKILESRITDVTTRNYRVTGKIDSPLVERVDENRLRDLLRSGWPLFTDR